MIRGGDDTPDEPEEIEESACEDVAFNFKDAIQSFHDEVLTCLSKEPEYDEKAVLNFTKSLDRIKNSRPETFKSAMYSFARDIDFSPKKGKKKTVRRIKVQSTSVSRRLYKSRGNTTSRKGRPPKVVLPKKREGEIVSHSLSQSVSANRAAEKKH